jgi:SAM-dependent methyltransferase
MRVWTEGTHVEDRSRSKQSEEALGFLLDYLACPTDNTLLLTTVRDPDGVIVALRSERGEYPVVHNIPCLIPGLASCPGGDQRLWQERQDTMWQEYQAGEPGIFSPEGDSGAGEVGEIIGQASSGLFLDVGCGAIPWPNYMTVTQGTITWIGVDPFFGDAERQFPFVQALGEYLPFRPQIFDGVLYASSIYHLLDPLQSLRRARTLLKPQGKLFVWYNRSRVNARYLRWKAMRAVGLARRYSDDFVWAFTLRALRSLLRRSGFALDRMVWMCETCPEVAVCDDPSEYLILADCV